MKYSLMLLLLLVFFVSTLPGGVIYYGSAIDPSGDVAQDDLVFGSVSIDDASMATFLVRFQPSSFLAGFSMASFQLDLDRNPTTGYAGTDGGHADSALMGVDAMVRLPYYTNGYAQARMWTGTGFSSSATHYAVTTLADGYSTTIPLADLGASSGLMNFKINSSRAVDESGSTGVEDRLTDIGQPVGSTTSSDTPEPATLVTLGVGLLALVGLRRRLT
jgi:hypothetical protein